VRVPHGFNPDKVPLGMSERKEGKTSVAATLDGVDGSAVSAPSLHQLIEGNLSQYLPGIRIHPIPLSDPVGRVCFVVSIPAGATAYQAKDRRYYGRSEFHVEPRAG
jgi:hypothetical protein